MKGLSRVEEFIRDRTPAAIVIQGKWGRGKTHCWNYLWSQYERTEAENARAYSYVSLFGVNSIQELKLTMALNLVERRVRPKAGQGWLSAKLGKMRTRAAEASKPLIDILEDIDAPIPGLGTSTNALAELYKAYAYTRLRDVLVCIDDIERRGDGLSIRDVLGYISQLVEQRNSSVVVILNDQSLGESAGEWEVQREKVFRTEVRFEPTPADCFEVAFVNEEDGSLKQFAKIEVENLGVTNIRIIRRIHDFLEHVRKIMGDETLREQTWTWIIKALVLLVYCHDGKGEGAPPMDRAILAQSGILFSGRNDERTPEEKAWDRVLEEYGACLGGDLNEVLAQMVRDGYADDDLRTVVKNLDARLTRDNIAESFNELFELHRNSFHDNSEEIRNLLRTRFPTVASFISIGNADGAISLARDLGDDALASSIIRQWIEARKGGREAELVPRQNRVFQPKDSEFRAATEAAFRESAELPGLEEAMNAVAAGFGGGNRFPEAILAASDQDIAILLRSGMGAAGRGFVETALSFPNQKQYPLLSQVRDKVRRVLELLASESEYLRRRFLEEYEYQAEAEPSFGAEDANS